MRAAAERQKYGCREHSHIGRQKIRRGLGKQYHKEGRALRTETVINDTYDLFVRFHRCGPTLEGPPPGAPGWEHRGVAVVGPHVRLAGQGPQRKCGTRLTSPAPPERLTDAACIDARLSRWAGAGGSA